MKILLIEDDLIAQMVYQDHLKKLQYEFDLVKDGQAACDLIDKIHSLYNAIILDLGLPLIRGESVLSKIRQYEKGERKTRIPIIVTSAHCSQEQSSYCLTLGACVVLIKPVPFLTLQNILSKIPKTS